MSELEGSTALLTGASRGIGRALARALAAEGARLVLSSRGGPALEEVAAETGGTPLPADLGRVDGPAKLAEATRERLGRAPDLLVNAAGVFGLAPVARTEADGRRGLDAHWSVNLRAPFLLVRAFLPEMLERGSGRLVHLGSVSARVALPENGAYAASKHGLRGFHEVLRLELAGTGVTTLLVEPGPVDTEAWDPLESRLGADLPARERMLRPSSVARAIVGALQLPEPVQSDLLLLPS